MKSGSSTLNPYASSYIPLSKRLDVDGNSVREFSRGDDAVWFGHQPGNAQGRYGNVSHSYAQSAEISKLKDCHGGEFYASSSHYQNEIPAKSNSDEEFDMDLAYLQMTFPGISDESLSDVYLANQCDLEAAVDMLNHLEPHPVDFSEKLPETLDIGDVPETGYSSYVAPPKLMNMTAEAAESSTSSSNLPSTS